MNDEEFAYYQDRKGLDNSYLAEFLNMFSDISAETDSAQMRVAFADLVEVAQLTLSFEAWNIVFSARSNECKTSFRIGMHAKVDLRDDFAFALRPRVDSLLNAVIPPDAIGYLPEFALRCLPFFVREGLETESKAPYRVSIDDDRFEFFTSSVECGRTFIHEPSVTKHLFGIDSLSTFRAGFPYFWLPGHFLVVQLESRSPIKVDQLGRVLEAVRNSLSCLKSMSLID